MSLLDYEAAAMALAQRADAAWNKLPEIAKRNYRNQVWAVLDAGTARLRALLEDAPRVWWCETHDFYSSHERGRCTYSVMKLMQIMPEEVSGCRMVERILLPVSLVEEG